MGGVCCSQRGKDRIRTPIVTISNKSRTAVQKMQQKETDMERMVQETIAKGKPWTDPDFPPMQKSLYDPSIDNKVDVTFYNSLSWKRASQIYKPVYIFEDGVEPNDVN